MDDNATIVMEAVRAADRDRYLSVLYAPEEKRAALFALYAFNAEIAGVRDRIREALPGEVRLQWWRDVISAGTRQAAAGHPVAEAVIETITACHLPQEAFLNYLDARIFDLYDDPMPSRNDLEGYCGETAAALIQLASLILEAEAAPEFANLAGHAGCAQAITGLLRLLPIHRSRGQCYIPREILTAVGSSPEEYSKGEAGAGAAQLVGAMIALAQEHLAAFEKDAFNLPATLRPAYLPTALTGPYLKRIALARAGAFTRTPELPAVIRQWVLFRHASRGWEQRPVRADRS
ncbi:phytoene/squalene synthase family protein [Pseudaminobacter sp. NGMCC 1.201702]|uniref:phytoene/squalene synthase family protein n=1 Tax=Pseudaminobacter sp. NGMCC 1.201702 TaxID=3391825 RepID=UPI0039EEFA1A